LRSLVAAGLRFGTLYADPPWPYRNARGRGAAARHYRTMPLDQIVALKEYVIPLAAARCHLHLWTTKSFLEEGLAVLKEWGFRFKSYRVWVKKQVGLGHYWRCCTEVLLLGVRGDYTFLNHSIPDYFFAPRRRHSEKPEEAREAVERVSPGPRLELFARKVTPGWTAWGDEVPVTEEIAMTVSEQPSVDVVEVDSIEVGERYRRDLGDLDGLAGSIGAVGMLHPVVITPARRLIAGRRRLEAVRRLGWSRVPARVVDLDDIVLGEDAENRFRKDLTPTEAVAIGRALEEREREQALRRQEATRAKEGEKVGARPDHETTVRNTNGCCEPGSEGGGKIPPPTANGEAGKTRDKVAAAVGMSGRTYDKAKAVVVASEEQPELFGDLPQQMDTTGKVDPAYQELRARAASPPGQPPVQTDPGAVDTDGDGGAVDPTPGRPAARDCPAVRDALRAYRRLRRWMRRHFLQELFRDPSRTEQLAVARVYPASFAKLRKRLLPLLAEGESLLVIPGSHGSMRRWEAIDWPAVLQLFTDIERHAIECRGAREQLRQLAAKGKEVASTREPTRDDPHALLCILGRIKRLLADARVVF
jgi:N6-adenosine-specific RNA methylase IME4